MPLAKRVKKKKDPSPAKAKRFSSTSCCAENDCTVVLVLLGFVLRCREIKDTKNVRISCLLKIYVAHTYAAVCIHMHTYLCYLLQPTLRQTLHNSFSI